MAEAKGFYKGNAFALCWAGPYSPDPLGLDQARTKKNGLAPDAFQVQEHLFFLSGPDLKRRSPGTHFKIRRRWPGQLKDTQCEELKIKNSVDHFQ